MFKKKKQDENAAEQESLQAEEAQGQSKDFPVMKAPKNLPSLPVNDSIAAGVIAVVFAAVGMLMAVKVCKEANPKEKKPKKPKKSKKPAKSE